MTGFELDESGAVKRVQTSEGPINVEQVIVAVGPWVANMWGLLGLPRRLEVAGEEREMWTYWYLQEGEIDVDPNVFVTADGQLPPVLHVDSHAPLDADDGTLITDEQWGVYFKQDKNSVQGGASPLPKGHDFQVDPYPTGSAEESFPDLWCAALSATAWSASRARARSTTPCAPAAWAPSRPTTSRCSTTCGRTCSWSPTQTTATR